MKPIPKALKLRESLSRKGKTTYDRFYNELLIPKIMLYLIEGNCKEGALLYVEGLLFEARRNYIVSLATAFEIFWREFIRESVDKTEVKKGQFKNLKFSFNDLVHILGHKLTLGELIASSFTFQSIEPIQKIAQEIFEFDFLSQFSRSKFELTDDQEENSKNKIITGEDILKNKHLIDNCFENRHIIVHDSGKNLNLSISEVEEIEKNMFEFCVFGAICWQKYMKI